MPHLLTPARNPQRQSSHGRHAGAFLKRGTATQTTCLIYIMRMDMRQEVPAKQQGVLPLSIRASGFDVKEPVEAREYKYTRIWISHIIFRQVAYSSSIHKQGYVCTNYSRFYLFYL